MGSTRQTFSYLCLLIVTITFVILALWIMFVPGMWISPKIQNNLNKTRLLQQKIDSKSLIYKELLIDSNDMYSRNFDKLIMVGGILFAGIGILFPVLMFFLQKQSLQDEKARIIEEAKKEIQEAQEKNQEEFRKLEEQIKNKTKNLWNTSIRSMYYVAKSISATDISLALQLQLFSTDAVITKNQSIKLLKFCIERIWKFLQVDDEEHQKKIKKFIKDIKNNLKDYDGPVDEALKIVNDFEIEFKKRVDILKK